MTVKRIVANMAAKEVGSAQAFYGGSTGAELRRRIGPTNTSARLTRSVRRASGLVLVGHTEVIAANGSCPASPALSKTATCVNSNRADLLSGSSFSLMLLNVDVPFFLFPIFFGLTARVIPLRSGLRVFCFLGTSVEPLGTPQECRR